MLAGLWLDLRLLDSCGRVDPSGRLYPNGLASNEAAEGEGEGSPTAGTALDKWRKDTSGEVLSADEDISCSSCSVRSCVAARRRLSSATLFLSSAFSSVRPPTSWSSSAEAPPSSDVELRYESMER
jgi:hypothetical protein